MDNYPDVWKNLTLELEFKKDKKDNITDTYIPSNENNPEKKKGNTILNIITFCCKKQSLLE